VQRPLGEVYEAMAEAYAEHAADSADNAHYDRPSVLDLCGDVAGVRVLDACCGPGFLAASLVERGARVVGFDASGAMVEMARRRLGGRAEIRRATLGEPLPFDDGSFDLVVCALAIHYVEDRVAALREIHRVVRPGGAAVISTQHPTSDWLRKGGSYFDVVVETDVWRLGDRQWDVRYWRQPLTALCDEVFRAGFLIERLVEPRPAASMQDRWPDLSDQLQRQPGLLDLRLVRPVDVHPA
jgi:SAM-dependent methyltransferase